MFPNYSKLSEDEVRRNTWGNTILYTFEEHPLYNVLEALYGKRKDKEVYVKNTLEYGWDVRKGKEQMVSKMTGQ